MSRSDFIDLATLNDNSLKLQCDICVIGAGAAGIYLAAQLAENGLDVILVEAGNIHCSDASTVGFEAQFESTPYPGATVGRYFGMGGSTSRWGGLLIPHTRHDLRKISGDSFDPWEHIVQTVAAKTDIVLTRLGWRHEAEFTEFAYTHLGDAAKNLNTSGFDVSASLLLPFRHKNLVYLLNQTRARVIYNAVAKEWQLEQGSATNTRLKQLLAVSSNGNQIEIIAERFIVAAGAIETARILLELDDTSLRPVLRSGPATGCFLSDHLSQSIAHVESNSLRAAIRLFAPRFVGDWMRSYRFIESDPPHGAPRAFLHFIFENMNPGFLFVRKILRAWQSRRSPELSTAEFVTGITGLLELGYKRYFRSVLHIPSGTPMHMQLDIEQEAVRGNRISLGANKDRYGRRVATINWGVSSRDIENIHMTAQRVLKKWPGKKAGLPELLPRIDGKDMTKPHEAYHPVATCRMGEDVEAVVDRNMKVWGLANLWVVSTGVLPNAGTANPTFTMLCLAEKLIERLTASVDSAEVA